MSVKSVVATAMARFAVVLRAGTGVYRDFKAGFERALVLRNRWVSVKEFSRNLPQPSLLAGTEIGRKI
jgi:hypothetical protein